MCYFIKLPPLSCPIFWDVSFHFSIKIVRYLCGQNERWRRETLRLISMQPIRTFLGFSIKKQNKKQKNTETFNVTQLQNRMLFFSLFPGVFFILFCVCLCVLKDVSNAYNLCVGDFSCEKWESWLCSRQRENLFEIVDRKWAMFGRVEKLCAYNILHIFTNWLVLLAQKLMNSDCCYQRMFKWAVITYTVYGKLKIIFFFLVINFIKNGNGQSAIEVKTNGMLRLRIKFAIFIFQMQ